MSFETRCKLLIYKGVIISWHTLKPRILITLHNYLVQYLTQNLKEFNHEFL